MEEEEEVEAISEVNYPSRNKGFIYGFSEISPTIQVVKVEVVEEVMELQCLLVMELLREDMEEEEVVVGVISEVRRNS